MDAELAYALAADPVTHLPFAWATLRPDDFEDGVGRWLFSELIEAWHLAGGDFSAGPHYLELLGHGYARRFGVSQEAGLAWSENLPRYDLPRWAFEHTALLLASQGAIRRTRAAVGRWYEQLTQAAIDITDRPTWEKQPYVVEPREYKDAPSARAALAGLLKEIRQAVRRAPEPPRRKQMSSGAAAVEVGW
jgi:hypothetical protein